MRLQNRKNLFFPGVGNFFEVAVRLRALGLDKVLKDKVLGEKTPILGICLGMHLFPVSAKRAKAQRVLILSRARYPGTARQNIIYACRTSDGTTCALAVFKGFDSIPDNSYFYFVHSYLLIAQEPVTNAAHSRMDWISRLRCEGPYHRRPIPSGKKPGTRFKVIKNFCEDKF